MITLEDVNRGLEMSPAFAEDRFGQVVQVIVSSNRRGGMEGVRP